LNMLVDPFESQELILKTEHAGSIRSAFASACPAPDTDSVVERDQYHRSVRSDGLSDDGSPIIRKG